MEINYKVGKFINYIIMKQTQNKKIYLKNLILDIRNDS